MQVKFTIPGRVGGKGRGRATARTLPSGKVIASVYTLAKTRSMEAMIRQYAAQAMGNRSPMEGPIELKIDVFQLVPPSWAKKKRESAFYLNGRPDVDNVCKGISDSCNNIVYLDDSQISDLHVVRRYIRDGQERVEVTVTAFCATAGAMPAVVTAPEPLPLFRSPSPERLARAAARKASV